MDKKDERFTGEPECFEDIMPQMIYSAINVLITVALAITVIRFLICCA